MGSKSTPKGGELQIDNQNLGQEETEGNPVEELSNSEQPAEQIDVNLPEGAKEETKEQFQKLLEHNKEMARKLEEYERQQQSKFTSVLDEVRPQTQQFSNLSATQVEDITKGLVDEAGYIDQDLLNKTLKQANDRAQRAEDRAVLAEQRIERFEETQLVRDVHAKHPELDPYSQSYNPTFRKEVRDEILKQMQRGYQDYEAAADKVKAEYTAKQATKTQVQEVKQEQVKKVISQREQASTTVSKATYQGQYEDQDEGVRKGDALSIGQLLQANGY